jgi:hypothetical protein
MKNKNLKLAAIVSIVLTIIALGYAIPYSIYDHEQVSIIGITDIHKLHGEEEDLLDSSDVYVDVKRPNGTKVKAILMFGRTKLQGKKFPITGMLEIRRSNLDDAMVSLK